jgi:hypothetical protein
MKEIRRLIYKLSPERIYKEVVSGRFIKTFPKGYWTEEDAKEKAAVVTRYMIEQRLQWNEKDIKRKITKVVFEVNKLDGMLHQLFGNSPYKAIDNAYPGKYKQWELKSVPNNFWTIETTAEATRWLIEEKLKWTEEDVKEKYCINIFIDNDLLGMTHNMFNNILFDVLDNAYPGKYKPEDIRNYNHYKVY